MYIDFRKDHLKLHSIFQKHLSWDRCFKEKLIKQEVNWMYTRPSGRLQNVLIYVLSIYLLWQRGCSAFFFKTETVFCSKFSLENAPFNLKIFEQLNTSKAHFCTTQNQIFFKNVMVLFYGQGSYLSRLRSHYQMTDYF